MFTTVLVTQMALTTVIGLWLLDFVFTFFFPHLSFDKQTLNKFL